MDRHAYCIFSDLAFLLQVCFTKFASRFAFCGNSVISQLLSLDSRVVIVLDSGTEGPGFESQSRLCRVTVLGKLFTLIVPLFTKQQNW